MKRKILLTVFALALVLLATPIVGTVMAIGPLKAADVGKNKHLGGGVALGWVILDDAGPNTRTWVNADGLITVMANAEKGKGRMNTAIIADIETVFAMQDDDALYENKWVYLSGFTGGETWDDPDDVPDRGPHGMMYWMIRPIFGHGYSAMIEAEHPYGVFTQRTLVG